MTKDGWKDVFEAVGLIAVIASLVFVGIETRNSAEQAATNARAIEIASYQELTNNIIAANLMVAGSNEMTDMLGRAARNPASLTTDERTRYRLWAVSRFRHADLAYFQFQRGVIDEVRLRSVLSPLNAVFRTEIGQEEWEYFRPNFVESFVMYVDEYRKNAPVRESVFEDGNDLP